MTKVQSKNAILFDIENDAGPLRDAMVATIGEGTALDPGLISALDKAKLDGIAAGATANATDAALRDRATHTGEQALGTITGLVDALAGKATPADVAAALAGLVDSSPATLDTLNELAAALGDDPNFATTVSSALGNRLRVDGAQGLTAPQQAQGRDNLGLGSAATAATDDFATATQGVKADQLPAGLAANGILASAADGLSSAWLAYPEVRGLLGLPIVFASVAAFAAMPSFAAEIKEVAVAGFYAEGDGGGHRKVRLSAPVAVKPWHTVLADGSIWEVTDPEYDIRQFGASPSRTAVQNSASIQDAIDAASTNRRKLHVRGDPIDCAGGLYVRSKLSMEWAPGAWLRQTDYASVGAFMTNVSPVQSERAVSDIILINPLIDLSTLTYDVSDTVHSSNGIGFARGAERITVWGGHIKGILPNFNAAGGWGGKAIGLDGGVKCFTAIGVRMESAFYGGWVRGNEGAFSNGLDGLEQTQTNKFIGCHFEDVSLPIAIQGRDPNEDPDYRAQDISAQFIASTYHNCGFAPDVPASNSNRYKGGIINLGEAQCFLIDGLTGWNDDDYVTQKGGWPATGDVIGQGLSGAPCHIVNGWGGAGTIRNIQTQGPVEDYWHCGRAFAMGDDAAPTKKVKVNYLFIDNIRHIGAAINVFSQDDYDQVAVGSDIRARMDNIFPYAVTEGLVAANAASLVSMTMKVFQSAAKWIEGTPEFIYNTVGNNLSGSDSQSWSENHRNSKPQSYPIKTVANGATISFPASKMEGLIAFACSASLAQGILKYRCVASATQASLFGGAISNVAITTGASPAGATNTLTFSFDDSGNVWVNNQRGTPVDITFNQLV